ncbi:MAG TPA: capsid cement protein [Anaerolineae bacterium]|nr:capsid cement protein [Anaerolineae bacterium]
MATNIVIEGHSVNMKVAVPVGTVAGDPVEIVDLHGVALTTRDGDGKATVKFPFAYVAKHTVEAVNNAGDSAVAIGDKLYYDTAADIKINKDGANGKGYGYALETIDAGGSDAIKVGVAAL